MSINEDSVPPFTAWRLTPKRKATPVSIVAKEQWGSTTMFVTSRRGTISADCLWNDEKQLLLHVQEWLEIRKATLKAELASIELRELKTNQRLRELTP